MKTCKTAGSKTEHPGHFSDHSSGLNWLGKVTKIFRKIIRGSKSGKLKSRDACGKIELEMVFSAPLNEFEFQPVIAFYSHIYY